MIEIVEASGPDQVGAVRELLGEYLAWAFTLDSRSNDAPTFHGIDAELADLPGPYAPPSGRLLAARVDGEIAGCVALKRVDATTGELKRLYVRPAFRGRNLGSLLVGRLVDEARAAGYRRLVLDSYHTMTSAHRVYQEAGFRLVQPPPGFPPEFLDVVVFMEMDLAA